MTDSILIVASSLEVRATLERCLRGLARLDGARSANEAQRMLEETQFALVIVDDSLSIEAGYAFLASFKRRPLWKDLPVILLSSITASLEVVKAFECGFDDFVSKPFDRNELRARIEAKLRRYRWERARSRAIRFDGLEIDVDEQRVVVQGASGPEDVRLTPLEFKVLTFLAKEPLRVFTREEILEGIWGKDIHIYDRTVDTYVSKLRKKLGSKADYVDSIHSVGYRLAAPSAATPLQRVFGGRELFQGAAQQA